MILDELQLNQAQTINRYQDVANLAKCISRCFAISTWENLLYTFKSTINTPCISYLATPENWEFDHNTIQFYQVVDNRGSGR